MVSLNEIRIYGGEVEFLASHNKKCRDKPMVAVLPRPVDTSALAPVASTKQLAIIQDRGRLLEHLSRYPR